MNLEEDNPNCITLAREHYEQLKRDAAPLTWTTDKPKEPGRYGMRDRDDKDRWWIRTFHALDLPIKGFDSCEFTNAPIIILESQAPKAPSVTSGQQEPK